MGIFHGFFILITIGIADQILPLTQRYFQSDDIGVDYTRGTFLIVLGHSSLKSFLEDESTGNFIRFKKTQGYDIKIIKFDKSTQNNASLKDTIKYYRAQQY